MKPIQLFEQQAIKKQPRFRMVVGTKAQSCNCCGHSLHKEPLVRMDYCTRSWGGKSASVNLCYRCVDAQHKAMKKELKKPEVMADMVANKL